MTWYDILHWGFVGGFTVYGALTAYSICFIITRLAKGDVKQMMDSADIRRRLGFIISGGIIYLILYAIAYCHK